MREIRVDNVVIGSGAAGLAAALRLWKLGEENTALVTENMKSGTSRNTGSDKQTYYKLSLSGEDRDSVHMMAEDLFSGGAVDGDTALCEAALSVRGFYNLVELGVPFPCNEYGEYMGYRTDHDRGRRATSAGPYTSRLMTEALEKALGETGVRILDRTQAIRLLTFENRICGVLCLNLIVSCGESADAGGNYCDATKDPYLLIRADNVILATGGPAGMYRDSVYPASQLGASGMAFSAGVKGKNLTEWQFGMASLRPRWNVSGSYMQVLPRFISTDPDGGDEREFLTEYFNDQGTMLSLVFLKGYQWPFDTAKCRGGSSLIDLLVYQETKQKGRRVWLDFRDNPGKAPIDFDSLSEEAHTYLEKAGALFGTPIERLMHMNAPAVSFYMDHGVDLAKEPLEIAVCAQHNNGGLSTDANWETGIRGLFAVGEVCGSHGITRPGGSALNAGQAGAIRASEEIHMRSIQRKSKAPDLPGKQPGAADEEWMERLRKDALSFAARPYKASGNERPAEVWKELTEEMSRDGGMIRNPAGISEALKKTREYLQDYGKRMARPSLNESSLWFRLYDMLLSRFVYLTAMRDYIVSGAGSRGSCLYTDPEGVLPKEGLPEIFRFREDGGKYSGMVQETYLEEDSTADVFRAVSQWRPVRPVPKPDDFFENQWREYRKRQGL